MPADATPLVTLDEAKTHLRESGIGPAVDADVEMKLNQATGLVLDVCNTTSHWRTVTAAWTEATVPPAVHAAILVQLSFLYAHRGDSEGAALADEDGLAPGVRGLLRRHRDPVMA